jgi:hypothetical protein
MIVVVAVIVRMIVRVRMIVVVMVVIMPVIVIPFRWRHGCRRLSDDRGLCCTIDVSQRYAVFPGQPGTVFELRSHSC